MQSNETQPENVQDGIEMTNDELASAMGFMTTVGDQDMMAQMSLENGSENAQDAPDEEQMPEEPQMDMEAMKGEMKAEMQEMHKEMMGEMKKEMKSMMKEEIKKLLDEDENESFKTSKNTE